MSAYYIIGQNREGIAVRTDRQQRLIADAADRFAAQCIEENRGYVSPCLIWQGSANFYMGEDEDGERRYANYRRAAFELAGQNLIGYTKFKAKCNTPKCCNMEHLTALNYYLQNCLA